MDEQGELPSAPKAAATTVETTQSSTSKKRKKRTPKPHILTQITLRNPAWAYIHLEHLISSGKSHDLDAVTAHLHLTAALSRFLGLHGTAIPFDILKLERQEVWIRLPYEDCDALIAAVGGWVSGNGEGWRVKGSSSWDANALGRDTGQDLFAD